MVLEFITIVVTAALNNMLPFLSSSALCLLQLKQVDVQFNFNKELNFPAVTFCNLTPLKRFSLECTRFDPNRTDPAGPCGNYSLLLAAAAAQNTTASQLQYEHKLRNLLQALKTGDADYGIVPNFNQSYPTQEEYAAYGFRVEDMLISCTWKGQPCSTV